MVIMLIILGLGKIIQTLNMHPEKLIDILNDEEIPQVNTLQVFQNYKNLMKQLEKV